MNTCPCCSSKLLKHWKSKQTYWYCSSCRQEMPNLEPIKSLNQYRQRKQAILSQDLVTHISGREKLSVS